MVETDRHLGPFTFDEVPSGRWSQARELGRSSPTPLHLTGSPSVPLPIGFLSEIDARLASTRVSARGRLELRESIGRRVEATTGHLLDPHSEILITNGAMHGLDCVFRALLPDGAVVGMICPGFFSDRLLNNRTRVVHIDTRKEDGWHVTDRVLAQVSESRLDALVVVNPGNPTGTVLSEEELRGLVDATEEAQSLLIVDEAYEAFVYEGRNHVSALSLGMARDRIVTVQSFTKSYGLVAARVGSVFGPAALLEPVARLLEWVTLASNPLSQAMALAALESADEWRPRLIDQFETNRLRLVEAVAAGSLPPATSIPEGATFSLLCVSGLGTGSEEAARRIWRATGIACVPGTEFPGAREELDRFVRLPIGADEQVFVEALDRLRRFFE